MMIANRVVSDADILLVIGTSLKVYPAAYLLNEAPDSCKIILIDPNPNAIRLNSKVEIIKGKAASELPKWIENFAKYNFE